MAKTVATLVGGVLLGIAGTWIAVTSNTGSDPVDEVVRDIELVPQMSEATAEAHRLERFEGLMTIAEIFALPDSFTRSEALYAVAGRSSAADVQNLIFEANRIADDYEREQALNVLFYRLAGLDPRSALALAQSDFFLSVRSAEQTVWRAWGRADLDEALFAAKTQPSRSRQNLAAQALYAAFGLLGNETTDRIEAELGIGPNRSTRARYIYRLADRSVEEAIAYINGLETVAAQNENISWLAYYLSLQDTALAITFAELFESPSNKERFRTIVESNVARENPRLTIDRILASGQDVGRSNEFFSAVRQLVRTDMDAAKAYFESYSNQQYRYYFGTIIAQQMVRDDPVSALEWARENDNPNRPQIEISVLTTIAASNPQMAIDEALSIDHTERRTMVLTNVITQIGTEDPQAAIGYVDQIPDPQQRRMALLQVSQNWLTREPEAAIDWVLTQEEEFASEVIAGAGYQLMHTNVDLAIRLLPRLDEESQQGWRIQIAQQLATNRSVEEAQSFVRQFENQPGYERLQTSLIQGVAHQDPLMAKQLADQLTDVAARDSAYLQIIAQRAQTNPTEAINWLANISDENMRGAATGQLASQWYMTDPQAATMWVTNLAAGPSRDDAIVQMSYQWADATDAQLELIASISDRDKRGQAKIRRIYQVMQTDPARARELLQDEDIPDYMRQRIEVNMSQIRQHF